MISKSELLEQLHEQGLMLDILEQQNNHLTEVIARKTAIIDAIVFFNDKIKTNILEDIDALKEFMNLISDNPIAKTATY